MKVIEIKNLTKKYSSKTAVNNMNLDINEGELFSLLGVNGSGKTTTIKILSLLSKPTKGKVLIYNRDINKNQSEIKSIINVSPQETAIAPNLTVKENLDFIAGIYKVKEKDKKVKEMLEVFELETVKNDRSNILSGGYKRRLSIAMALITSPKILFLDEPTLGLDVLSRRKLWDIINKLKGKMTIILTTHYMEESEFLSDRVGILSDGSIIEVDTPKNIIKKSKSKTFEDAFIKKVNGGNK